MNKKVREGAAMGSASQAEAGEGLQVTREEREAIRQRALKGLCWYDPRNPCYTAPLDGDEPRPPRGNCACDSCFYGRDTLAMDVLALIAAVGEGVDMNAIGSDDTEEAGLPRGACRSGPLRVPAVGATPSPTSVSEMRFTSSMATGGEPQHTKFDTALTHGSRPKAVREQMIDVIALRFFTRTSDRSTTIYWEDIARSVDALLDRFDVRPR